jgi:hypothetical protein
MDCCGLSSTGLQNIDANELTADNATIFSNLNVSGYSFLNNVLINDNSTLLSSLNVSGFTPFNKNTTLLSSLNVSGVTTLNNNTTLLSSLNVGGITALNNTTNINGQLNVSGLNVLNILNSFGTDITNLNNSIIQNQNQINIHETGLSTLNNSIVQNQNQINIHETGLSTLLNFRSDNSDAIVRLTGPSILVRSPFETLFDSTISNSIFLAGASPSTCLTKIDPLGRLNVFHPYSISLPNKIQSFWVVHDEIEGFHQQAIINAG